MVKKSNERIRSLLSIAVVKLLQDQTSQSICLTHFIFLFSGFSQGKKLFSILRTECYSFL